MQRILNILQNTEISFTEYDDLTVRRLVECIQVCGKEKIIVTLKGATKPKKNLEGTTHKNKKVQEIAMYLELFCNYFSETFDRVSKKWHNHCVNKSEAAISAIFASLSF